MKATTNIQRLQSIVILILAAVLGLLFYQFQDLKKSISSNDIIRTKGIIIEDEQGQARMMMGFPIQASAQRQRTDTLEGIVLMDEKGVDRVHLGKHGQLFLGNKYYDRTNDGWSLFFNDGKGEERSGYGFSDSDNSVGLGMDYGGANGGEAIYLYAAPELAFLTINADLQENSGIRDRIVLWHDSQEDLSIVKVSDSQKDGRITLKAEKGLDPKIQYTDERKKTTVLSKK